MRSSRSIPLRMRAPRMALLASAVALALAQPVAAATFTVSNTANSGAGSLRQAVLDANAAAGADIIVFSGAGASGTITLTSGQIAITGPVTITGPGAALLSVSGNNASRIFELNDTGAVETVITGLRLTAGNSTNAAGGAILQTDGPLRIEDSVVTANTSGTSGGGGIAASADTFTMRRTTVSGNTACCGGGVYADGGPTSVLIEDSTISGNSATDDGGGLYSTSDMTMRRSNVTGNTATDGGGGFYLSGVMVIEDSTISNNTATNNTGGGIYIDGDSLTMRNVTMAGNSSPADFGAGLYVEDTATAVIESSTLSGNTGLDGAGLTLYSTSGPITVSNSTISSNTASGDGGGVYLYGNTGPIQINNSTVVGNTATGQGGGIYLYDGETLTISNTIVGNNTSSAGTLDVGGDGTLDMNYSLLESASTTATVNSGADDVVGSDPALGPLANNGGPTLTHLPTAGSVVVDRGDPAFVPPPATDQRGTGFPRVFGGRIDIGSVERGLGGSVSNPPQVIPLWTDAAKWLALGLVGLGGIWVLRRRKVAPGVTLAAVLCLGAGADPAQAADVSTRTVATVSAIEVGPTEITLRLSDGTSVSAPAAVFDVHDRRLNPGVRVDDVRELGAGMVVRVKIDAKHDGRIKDVNANVFDSLDAANARPAR